MKIHLSIMLGLNCNFRCSHCLNDSRPGFKAFDISAIEIANILSEVKKHSSITTVSFSGGEPLLYVEQIESLIHSIRLQNENREFRFSITTNGSLLEKYADRLKALNLNGVIISFDQPHSEFQSLENLERAIVSAKAIFQQIELTTTFEKSPTENVLYSLATKHNILVNFSRSIKSGRKNIGTATGSNQLSTINCPNLESFDESRLKINYLPTVGYTFCCGPLLFDNLNDFKTIAFSSIDEVLNSEGYLLQRRLAKIKVKKTAENSCENCVATLRNQTFLKFKHFALSDNNWNNTITDDKVSPLELQQAESFFNIRRIGVSQPTSFQNLANQKAENQTFEISSGSQLSQAEISNFSDFTIETFYKIYTDSYSEKDIEVFRSQQEVFFRLPYQYIRHSQNGKIVGFLVVAKLPEHPYNGEPAWHIGYWGISQALKDRNSRNLIKNDWQTHLRELSSTAPVIVVVDESSPAAVKMTRSFGMDVSTLRFDTRST